MQCASVYLASGRSYLIVTNPQPADITTCTYVVGNYGEFSSALEQISPTQGSQIAGAILFVWAVAWVFRQIIRTLNVGKNEGNHNE